MIERQAQQRAARQPGHPLGQRIHVDQAHRFRIDDEGCVPDLLEERLREFRRVALARVREKAAEDRVTIGKEKTQRG